MGEDGKHASADSVQRSDGSFSKMMVITCIVAWVAYFAVFVVYKFFNPTGTWDTALTAAWFAGFGGELVMLASIKRSRIKNKYESEGR